jgi:predicted  nucleic acid-binding Zn ribbon protein
MRKSIQKIVDRRVIVRFAVVGGQPAASARGKQGPVCPAVWVHRVDENDVALLDCDSDGGLVGR